VEMAVEGLYFLTATPSDVSSRCAARGLGAMKATTATSKELLA
jgi:hypothetical protein